MEAFSFVLKTVLFTAVLVWLCQFKIENKSVEKHFMEFVRHSKITEPIHKIADGSRKLANDGWDEVKYLTGTGTATNTKTTMTRKASAFKWTWGSDSSQDSSTTEDSDRESEDTE